MGLVNLSLATKFVSLEELVRQLNSADLLFLPMMPFASHEAGIPAKLFEYMACGKPIICSSNGEPANLVRRTGCGIVVSTKNVNEAVQAILKLKANKSLQSLMGR